MAVLILCDNVSSFHCNNFVHRVPGQCLFDRNGLGSVLMASHPSLQTKFVIFSHFVVRALSLWPCINVLANINVSIASLEEGVFC